FGAVDGGQRGEPEDGQEEEGGERVDLDEEGAVGNIPGHPEGPDRLAEQDTGGRDQTEGTSRDGPSHAEERRPTGGCLRQECGNAAAEARGREGLPGEEHTEEELPIDLFGEAHVLDHGTEDGFLVYPAQPVEDSAGLQRFDETRDGRRVALRLVEDGGRDVHLPGRG